MFMKNTRVQIFMTKEDLKVMAFGLAKLIGTDKKIQVIKALRDATADVIPVDEFGMPLTETKVCPTCKDPKCGAAGPSEVVKRFGLRECKEALDSWYDPDNIRTFIG